MRRSLTAPFMLSYLHAFHAGNHADVLKHAMLQVALDYIAASGRPFLYVDTHAGAGRYDLLTDRAQQHRKFATGIGRLWDLAPERVPEPLSGYLRTVRDEGKIKKAVITRLARESGSNHFQLILSN